MPIGSILWGASSSGLSYQNTVQVGYPLYDVLTDRELREGSQTLQAPSGVEDAWITGRDYVIDAEVRWIDDSPTATPTRAPVGGPGGWQDFLDFARAKNPVRFVPDVTNAPSFYVDGCYLVEPIKGYGSNQENLQRAFRLKLRNPTVDFIRALRSIMFEYYPGRSLTDPLAASFARADAATCATYADANGIIRTVAANVLRDREYVGGVRVARLEGSRQNICLQSEALGTTWTVTRASVSSNADTAPDGNVTADRLIEDATAAATHFAQQSALVITANANVAVSAFVKPGTRSWVRLTVIDSTGTDGFSVYFNASTGAIGSNQLNGTGTVLRSRMTLYANGFYRCEIVGNVGNARTAVFTRLYLANADNGFSYNGDGASYATWWGIQLENNVNSPSSYIATAAAAVTRALDLFSYPFSFAPQAMTFYVKFIELGTVLGASTLDVLTLGGGTNPRIQIRQPAGDGHYQVVWSDGTTTVSSTLAAAPSYGDTVELRATLAANGAVQLSQSINGAAEVSAAASAALTLPSAWSDTALYIDSEAGGNTPGAMDLVRVVVAAGSKTLAQMRAL